VFRFRGITALSLDAKGRLAIPARYRQTLLEQCEGRIVITINPDHRCLWLYPLEVWEGIEDKLVRMPGMQAGNQRLKRLLIGHATDCEMDASGRVLVPPPLREFGDLNKRVMLVGQGNKFEIWDEAQWSAETDAALASAPDDSSLSVDMENLAL